MVFDPGFRFSEIGAGSCESPETGGATTSERAASDPAHDIRANYGGGDAEGER